MNIVMLGHSNAGKTAYVASMYGIMNSGLEGFQVRAARAAEGNQLRRRAQLIAADQYPPRTDRRSTYALQLWHASARVMDFVWKDYRGGALQETSESEQARQLRADMAAADGLVLMIDSTELLHPTNARSYVRPLVSTAIRLLAQRSDPMPVVLALTKWDMVRGVGDTAGEAATEFLGSLVRAIADTKHLHGVLVPVACGSQPANVAIPVLWCLHVGIALYAGALDDQIRLAESRRQFAQSQQGGWDAVTSWWKGEPTWASIADSSASELREYQATLAPLVPPATKLAALFQNVDRF